jgi:hypothetical protein
MTDCIPSSDLAAAVDAALDRQPVIDMHTHLYPPSFGTPMPGRAGRADPNGLMLWGVDELLTYHYLVAEVFRVVPATVLPYEQFWKMSKRQQADHIWKHLFVDRAPISEACRGVLTTIKKLGLDASDPTPARWRGFCDSQDPSDYIDRVMKASNVSSITMTNNVFDDNERQRWLNDPSIAKDPRFTTVLRFDQLLQDFPSAARMLSQWGYAADGANVNAATIDSVKRFLNDWIDRMKPIYLALSLPPTWRHPADSGDPVARAGQTVLEKAILPMCEEQNLPFAMMIGSKRGVNPALRDAGDMGGLSDVQSVATLCRDFPKNRFFVTMLARENQHDLAVAARKFGNLMVFGCWWFLNNPTLIQEITSIRMELLGTSFIPQHSDCRVLDQLIYKWEHSRRVIAKVLTRKFADLAATGRPASKQQIEQTIKLMLVDNFENFRRGHG